MTQDERLNRMQNEIDELRKRIAAMEQRCDTYPFRRGNPWDGFEDIEWWRQNRKVWC